MSSTVKVLALAGSERMGSVNVKLVKYAASKLQEIGAEVTIVDLKLGSGGLSTVELYGNPEEEMSLGQIVCRSLIGVFLGTVG